jgi:hypothetical protein
MHFKRAISPDFIERLYWPGSHTPEKGWRTNNHAAPQRIALPGIARVITAGYHSVAVWARWGNLLQRKRKFSRAKAPVNFFLFIKAENFCLRQWETNYLSICLGLPEKDSRPGEMGIEEGGGDK